jgi:hypothetical protein
MTTHVFIGAGPANLDRALKIKKRNPNAQFVFLDKRVSADGQLNREYSRANIFRFPLSDKQKIIENGVSEEAFNAVSTERDFSEKEGFQKGDTKVFGDERFTQIQIRDLQQLYLDVLKGPNTTFLDLNADLDTFHKIDDMSEVKASIEKSITDEIEALQGKLDELVDEEYTNAQQRIMYLADKLHDFHQTDDLTYHVAAGALQEGPTREESTTPDTVIYPAKSEDITFSGASPDLAAMPVTAMHGTTTFQLSGSGINPEDFVKSTISLDDAPWQEALAKHGWNLLRPPRVRLFYANDTLYIGTEVPASFASQVENGRPNATYKQMQEDFTREIAKLMLPNYAAIIEDIPANTKGVNAPTFFLTNRGETGDVLNISDNAAVIAHGDRRYLPHYQTGSGFLTATQQNDVYVDIYLKDNFDDLYQWAFDNGHVTKDKQTTLKEYEKAVANEPHIQLITGHEVKQLAINEAVLKHFKADLYTFTTHEILDTNKQKVDKYFTQLQNQALSLLSEDKNFKGLVKLYNRNFVESMHVSANFKPRSGMQEGLNPNSEINEALRPIVIMEMLLHGNDAFLKETLPKLVNVDLSDINIYDKNDVEQLHNLRDSFTDGYMKYVNCSEVFQKLDADKKERLLSELVKHHDEPEKVREKIASVVGICPSHKEDIENMRDALLEQEPLLVALLKNYSGKESTEMLEFATHNIIKDDVDAMQVKDIANKLKAEFDKHPELLKTKKGFGLFKLRGVHADKIEAFTKKLDKVINGEGGELTEQKQLIAESLLELNKQLVEGKSQRTIDVLSDAVKNCAPEQQEDVRQVI